MKKIQKIAIAIPKRDKNGNPFLHNKNPFFFISQSCDESIPINGSAYCFGIFPGSENVFFFNLSKNEQELILDVVLLDEEEFDVIRDLFKLYQISFIQKKIKLKDNKIHEVMIPVPVKKYKNRVLRNSQRIN